MSGYQVAGEAAAEAVTFDQVEVGDTLTFLTADNGYGGTGTPRRRPGVVTRKTDHVVDLNVGGGLPVFERGKGRPRGAGARLRRADWSSHGVHRIAT
ncbi:hypothetical protein Psi02_72410 [Planotetraspora silvatica]|uniref:Uncharacterized protein n=1 Tax=Planotetraspora silvatica TaxID=234614 RepID=A0A8J3UVX5_9ACTN|nr:hypothetical protein [Planotetraspora silvatica]GII50817.1 hypothetical protein Psi02_72410 [Planotetraspora silvatica]